MTFNLSNTNHLPEPVPRTHDVGLLFDEVRSVEPYPPEVVAVPAQIPGNGFFPGATGLWSESRSLRAVRVGGVMILGHDFHSVKGYEQSLCNGAESASTPTWRHLLFLLTDAQIPLDECFFTNAYMGLRVGTKSTGTFPGAKCEAFTRRCQKFFLHQVAILRPRLIIVLGNHVPQFIATLSSQLVEWSSLKTFSKRDAAQKSVVNDAVFIGIDAPACVVVSVVHPSFRPPNVVGRRWQSLEGEVAETALLRHAYAIAVSRHFPDSAEGKISP